MSERRYLTVGGQRREIVDLRPEPGRALGEIVADLADARAALELAREGADPDGASAARQAVRILEAEVTRRRESAQHIATEARRAAEAQVAARPDMPDWEALSILTAADALELADAPLGSRTGEPPAPTIRIAGDAGALGSVGEVLLVTGSGGAGKSSAILQAVLGAAEPDAPEWTEALPGLDFRRGPAFLAAYEDRPERIRERADAILEGAEIPAAVSAADMRARPIYGPRAETGWSYEAAPGRTAHWPTFWSRALARIEEGRESAPGPGYVVIDPGAEAFTGDDRQTGAVREFLAAVSRECERIGCAPVVIVHPSKRMGSGADAIAGTAAWHDAARGVLALSREGDAIRLRAIKSNYGRTGDVASLRRAGGGEGRFFDPDTEGDATA
ncbi:MAG: AAA family ATPase [Alphaproteobacteria bacterium]|nr:AAA family ATPase [Alphaproteobacteria bacterium]